MQYLPLYEFLKVQCGRFGLNFWFKTFMKETRINIIIRGYSVDVMSKMFMRYLKQACYNQLPPPGPSPVITAYFTQKK